VVANKGLGRKVPKGSMNSHTAQKTKFDLSLDMLDKMIMYFFTENLSATKATIIAMDQLFGVICETSWSEDDRKASRVFIVKRYLDKYLYCNLRGETLFDTVFEGGQYEADVNEIIDEIFEADDDGNLLRELSDEDIYAVNVYVADRLQFGYLFDYVPVSDDLSQRLQQHDYVTLSDINDEFREHTASLNRRLQQTEQIKHATGQDVSLSRSSLDTAFANTITALNQTSNIIRTGIRELNVMLNGGFQAGRVYLFIGMTGGWKSGFLLSCVKWFKSHNPDIRTKDPTKKPIALYLTQENDTDETMQRFYVMCVPLDEQRDLKDLETSDVLEQLDEHGWLNEDDDKSAADIVFRYRPSKSISTQDLDAMIDELATQGYEVCLLVHDYVKRIRPATPCGDAYVELGDVIDEFSIIAKQRKFPVVTASQINRGGIQKIEEAAKQQSNTAQNLGLSVIGDSARMAENADGVYILHRETKQSENQLYLTVRRLKQRGGGKSEVAFFAQPFLPDNEMCLVEDADMMSSACVYDLSDNIGANPVSSTRSSLGNGAAKRKVAERPTRPKASTTTKDVDDSVPMS
jgi:replicative DNA helicase